MGQDNGSDGYEPVVGSLQNLEDGIDDISYQYELATTTVESSE